MADPRSALASGEHLIAFLPAKPARRENQPRNPAEFWPRPVGTPATRPFRSLTGGAGLLYSVLFCEHLWWPRELGDRGMGEPAEFVARLAMARAGEGEALGRVLDSCRGYLLMIARQELDAGLQAKGGASDLVQETFVDAQR